jgi:hypothetical protein
MFVHCFGGWRSRRILLCEILCKEYKMKIWTKYERVIPRDLFNEATLLKCMGKVCLLIEDRMINLQIREASPSLVNGFDIRQDISSGDIKVANLSITLYGIELEFFTPLNSREPWPLRCTHPDIEDEIEVFNQDGSLNEQFNQLVKWMI